MKNKLQCVMLIDDNEDDNFYHEREITKSDSKSAVILKESGIDALDYLKSDTHPHSDLIFLDINMPGMNGWDFLKEYDKLDPDLRCGAVVIMLTTSRNEDDIAKAKEFPSVTAYITKPLTRDKFNEIHRKYFI